MVGALDGLLRNSEKRVSLARLKERDPNLYDVKVNELRLDAQVSRLLDQLEAARVTSSAAAGDLESQLLVLVEQQVGYSLVARGMYLRRLSEHVNALRDELSHDSANFEAAVERRMQELLNEIEVAPADPTPPSG